MTENELMGAVIEMIEWTHGRYYHTYESRRSNPGWPDLVIAYPGRLLVRELKTAKGKVTAEQSIWLALLAGAGLDTGVWRPADLRSGRISSELQQAKRAGKESLRQVRSEAPAG